MIFRWKLIRGFCVCYIVTLHCQNVGKVFNFTETVLTRNSRNKSHGKFKAFTVLRVSPPPPPPPPNKYSWVLKMFTNACPLNIISLLFSLESVSFH